MSETDDAYRVDPVSETVEGSGSREPDDPVPMRSGRFQGYADGQFHRIAYTDWGDPGASRLAICVHGLSRQGRDFDPLARTLARRGWRVVCPDLPGRGRSDWLANSEHYAMPNYAADMAALIAGLGAREVDWIGTSLGGLIGIVLAGAAATPIRRLVVNDIGPFLPWSALYRIGTQLRTAPRAYASLDEATQRLRTVHAPFGPLTDTQWQHLARHSFVADEAGYWHPHFDPAIGDAFRLGSTSKTSFWRAWDAITCPTLLLRGEHSDLLLANTADEMTQRGPRATCITIPGCGHAPALLDDGQIGLVADWLGGERGVAVSK